jgi:ferritin
MLNKKMEDALNEQLNFELYSAYIYQAISAYFESINLKGMAKWMRVQAMEEQTHAKKFYDYILERGGRVILTAIGDPGKDWESPINAFESALEHEEKVTARINKLTDTSYDLKDHASVNFLQWFINEQVEEEATVHDIIQNLKLAGDSSGLFMLDKELGSRMFVPPVGFTI